MINSLENHTSVHLETLLDLLGSQDLTKPDNHHLPLKARRRIIAKTLDEPLHATMAEISQTTVDHSKQDIAENPDHVQAQQLEAMTPAATRPTSPGGSPQDKAVVDQQEAQDDMEDKLSNALAPAKSGSRKSRHGKKERQKKIAVLTSGGDSAGMNAAGESAV